MNSREALLTWSRNFAPDLRIGHALVNGSRACFAKFSFRGEEHEIEALGEDPDYEVAFSVAETLRAALRLPSLRADRRDLGPEQAIVLASLAGDNDEAERLARELVLGRAHLAQPVIPKRFTTKREGILS